MIREGKWVRVRGKRCGWCDQIIEDGISPLSSKSSVLWSLSTLALSKLIPLEGWHECTMNRAIAF